MDLTFGVVTKYEDESRLVQILDSIEALSVPNYEVLFVGGGSVPQSLKRNNVVHVPFDESVKQGWITKKKNTVALQARYEVLVLLHDYHVFDKNWYTNFVQFGTDWDVCCTSQVMVDGRRNFVDWALWDKPGCGRGQSLDYNDWSQTQYQYVSGAFFLVKKKVLLEEPFDENLTWNEAEDVEWSLRVRSKYKLVCNGKSVVYHNKVHRHNFM